MFTSTKKPNYTTKRYELYLDTMKCYDKAAREWGELRIVGEGLQRRLASQLLWTNILLSFSEMTEINNIMLELELLG